MHSLVARSATSTTRLSHSQRAGRGSLIRVRPSGTRGTACWRAGALDLVESRHTALADGGIVGAFAHARRIVPAALAFFAVGAAHCDGQARQRFGANRIGGGPID